MSFTQEQSVTTAPGLEKPCYVREIEFNQEEQRFDLYLDFQSGSKFICSGCSKETAVYDFKDRIWRQLNFFRHKSYLHAREPQVKCSDCGVLTEPMPWVRPKSGFNLLLESFILALACQMPVKTIATFRGGAGHRLWRILHDYVNRARIKSDHSKVTDIGVDEIACRRGSLHLSGCS